MDKLIGGCRILDNIEKLENILLKDKELYNYDNSDVKEIISEPVIIMNTLHSCYSHAIIDDCFPIYWIIQDLISNKIISSNNVRILITSKDIFAFPKQNLPLINAEKRTYNGVWNDIINLLTPFPIIFQHLSETDYLFKTCFYLSEDPKYRWQRTPWNCSDYYPGRNIKKADVIFQDDKIYSMLSNFRSYVLDKTLIENEIQSTNLIIIDRKYDRKIDTIMLENLVKEAKNNISWKFDGVYYLEDLTFSEQIQLFNKTRFYIFRHGSCLVNLLWVKPKSVVFELAGGPNGNNSPHIINRICKLTDSTQVLLNYNNFNMKTDIYDYLEKNY
jgi:hypothetical protein